MKSGVFQLIGGAFAGETAPFAVHPLDRARAAQYLHAAIQQALGWAEAESDIRAYLGERGLDDQAIQREIDRARPLLQPWLS